MLKLSFHLYLSSLFFPFYSLSLSLSPCFSLTHLSLVPGCCFLTFSSKSSALEARDAFHDSRVLPGVSIHYLFLLSLSLSLSLFSPLFLSLSLIFPPLSTVLFSFLFCSFLNSLEYVQTHTHLLAHCVIISSSSTASIHIFSSFFLTRDTNTFSTWKQQKTNVPKGRYDRSAIKWEWSTGGEEESGEKKRVESWRE